MQYDLVFEGGGAKGMVFVGAMQEFEARGNSYDRLLGTSAGAITATFLAAGYSSQEMLAALGEREGNKPVFAGFLADPTGFDDEVIRKSELLARLQNTDLSDLPFRGLVGNLEFWLVKILARVFPNLFSFIEWGGLYSADNFVSWMRRKLGEGTFAGRQRDFSEMTLAEFYQATARDLSLVTSDTTDGRMLILNHKTAPELPVVMAVRMSMSIPFAWPEVIWRQEWGSYRGREMKDHRLVDGGILSNFPIELFLSREGYIIDVMGEKEDSRVLGLLIDESLTLEAPPPPPASSPFGFLGKLLLVQRFMRLANTTMSARDKDVLEAYEQMVVSLPAGGYGTTEFDMSDERRDALVAAGRKTMRDYLNFRDEAPFALEEEESYEINLADHADRVARRILEES